MHTAHIDRPCVQHVRFYVNMYFQKQIINEKTIFFIIISSYFYYLNRFIIVLYFAIIILCDNHFRIYFTVVSPQRSGGRVGRGVSPPARILRPGASVGPPQRSASPPTAAVSVCCGQSLRRATPGRATTRPAPSAADTS